MNKRKASSQGSLSYNNRPYKRPRQATSSQTTRAIVRKEMAKKGDLKYTDTTSPASNMTSTGALQDLFGNATRGDGGLNNFNGNSCTVRGLTLNYGITTNQTFNFMRVLLFQWYSSTVPTVATVLQNTALTSAVFSPINIQNREQIKVLYNKVHSIFPDNTATGYAAQNYEVYVPGSRMKKVRFAPSANNTVEGGLWMIIISDDSAVTYPQISWYSRVSFYD